VSFTLARVKIGLTSSTCGGKSMAYLRTPPQIHTSILLQLGDPKISVVLIFSVTRILSVMLILNFISHRYISVLCLFLATS